MKTVWATTLLLSHAYANLSDYHLDKDGIVGIPVNKDAILSFSGKDAIRYSTHCSTQKDGHERVCSCTMHQVFKSLFKISEDDKHKCAIDGTVSSYDEESKSCYVTADMNALNLFSNKACRNVEVPRKKLQWHSWYSGIKAQHQIYTVPVKRYFDSNVLVGTDTFPIDCKMAEGKCQCELKSKPQKGKALNGHKLICAPFSDRDTPKTADWTDGYGNCLVALRHKKSKEIQQALERKELGSPICMTVSSKQKFKTIKWDDEAYVINEAFDPELSQLQEN